MRKLKLSLLAITATLVATVATMAADLTIAPIKLQSAKVCKITTMTSQLGETGGFLGRAEVVDDDLIVFSAAKDFGGALALLGEHNVDGHNLFATTLLSKKFISTLQIVEIVVNREMKKTLWADNKIAIIGKTSTFNPMVTTAALDGMIDSVKGLSQEPGIAVGDWLICRSDSFGFKPANPEWV